MMQTTSDIYLGWTEAKLPDTHHFYCLESTTNTPPGPITKVGPALRDGQVMQDRPPLPLQRIEQPGGASLP
jgi:hypothetical protein